MRDADFECCWNSKVQDVRKVDEVRWCAGECFGRRVENHRVRAGPEGLTSRGISREGSVESDRRIVIAGF